VVSQHPASPLARSSRDRDAVLPYPDVSPVLAPTMTPADLVVRWREQAAQYDRDGQPGGRLLTRVAKELEDSLTEATNPLLSLTDAADRSGYHRESLARLVRAGKLRNYGTQRKPLVRLQDLPKKAERPRLTLQRAAGIVGAQ
jgi:hypothetical protein